MVVEPADILIAPAVVLVETEYIPILSADDIVLQADGFIASEMNLTVLAEASISLANTPVPSANDIVELEKVVVALADDNNTLEIDFIEKEKGFVVTERYFDSSE